MQDQRQMQEYLDSKIRLAVEISGKMLVINRNQIKELADASISYRLAGRVCPLECTTLCSHYRQGTCPCTLVRDIHGKSFRIYAYPQTGRSAPPKRSLTNLRYRMRKKGYRFDNRSLTAIRPPSGRYSLSQEKRLVRFGFTIQYNMFGNEE